MLRRGNLCRVSPLEDTSVGSTSSSPPSPDPEDFRRHSLERVRGGGCEIRQFQQRKTNKTQIPIHVFELSSSFYTAGSLNLVKIDNNDISWLPCNTGSYPWSAGWREFPAWRLGSPETWVVQEEQWIVEWSQVDCVILSSGMGDWCIG